MENKEQVLLLTLKQNIAKLLMESDVQYLINAINWLDNIVCQIKATNNIAFNNENYEEGFTFPAGFLQLVSTNTPILILKAIPWIDMKVCEARVLGTVTLDEENGLNDPIWVSKWLKINDTPFDANCEQSWTDLVLAVTSILYRFQEDLQEVVEWFERKVATYKIGGGSFNLSNQDTNTRLIELDDTFNQLISNVSDPLLMIFMLWIDHKLAENRLTSEFSFEPEVPLYSPEWLKIIHDQTTSEPSLLNSSINEQERSNYDSHMFESVNNQQYLSPTFQREYYDIQRDMNYLEEMPIQKLPVMVQTLTNKDAKTLGLVTSNEPVVISVQLKKPEKRGPKTRPDPMPSYITVIESAKTFKVPEMSKELSKVDESGENEKEFTCPHCSQKMPNMNTLSEHLTENGISFEWVQMGDQMSVIIAEESDEDGEEMSKKVENDVLVFQVATQTTSKLERHLFPPLKKFTKSATAKAFDGRRVVSESVLAKLTKARSMRTFGRRKKLSSEEEDEEVDESNYGSVITPGGEQLSPIPSDKSHLKALKAVSRGTRSRPARSMPQFAFSEEEEEEEPKSKTKKKPAKGRRTNKSNIIDSDSSVSFHSSSESSESVEERVRPRRSIRKLSEKSSNSNEEEQTEAGTYPCPYCSEIFNEPGVLGQHLFDHVYPNKRKDTNEAQPEGNVVDNNTDRGQHS